MHRTNPNAIAKVNANRVLAAVLRAHGVTPNGDAWSQAKKLVGEGFSPKQAARLVRSTMPEAEQVKALAIAQAPIAQAPAPKRKLSSRAEQVRAGAVLRDSKGRLVSRDIQAVYELIGK